MTYEELMQLYLSSGGFENPVGNPNDGGSWDQSWIALPDGTYASRTGDGGLARYSDVTGSGYNMGYFHPDGTPAGGGYLETPDLSAGRSLLNAALTLGLPAAAMNALPALLGGGAGSAGGGAALVDAAAGTGGLAATPGLGAGSGVAGAIDAMMTPAAASAATGGAASVASGLGAGSGIAGAIDSMMTPTAAAGPSMLPRLPDGSLDLATLLRNPALLAAGAGALAGIAGNSDIRSSNTTTGNAATTGTTTGTTTGNTNQSSSQSLAPWLQGYAQDYVSRAQQQAGMPSSNATMDAARGLLTTGATQGDPLVNAARGQQANVIGGGLLGGNPYLDQVAANVGRQMGDAYALGTRGAITSAFNQSGSDPRFNSAYGQMVGKADENFARGLGDTMSNLFFNNYQTERNAQDAASRGSLGFGQFGQNAASNLYGIGSQDWMRPFQQNQFFGQAINPAFGSQSNTAGNTQQQNMQNVNQNVASNQTAMQNISAPNNWMAGLGGAAAGAGIWRQLFGGR